MLALGLRLHFRLMLLLMALAAMAAAVLFQFDPSRSAFYPGCMFHRMTGLLCPGCGSLRACHQLLHGHWAAAFHDNPLLILTLIAGAVYLLLTRGRSWSGQNPQLGPGGGESDRANCLGTNGVESQPKFPSPQPSPAGRGSTPARFVCSTGTSLFSTSWSRPPKPDSLLGPQTKLSPSLSLRERAGVRGIRMPDNQGIPSGIGQECPRSARVLRQAPWLWIYLGIVLVFWVARNLPGPMFAVLRP